jgi:ABC-type sugar transport systems, permease components
MNKKSNFAGYMFLLPWLIGFFCLRVVPAVSSAWFSLTNFDMFTDAKFIGLANYQSLFSDPRFLKSIRVTFTFVFLSVPLQLAFSLMVALILKKNRKGTRVYRAAYYLPSLFGGSVAVAILWRQIFTNDGVFNRILGMFGIQGVNWIATPGTSLYTLIALTIWQFGASMVIFLSALKQIPEDYYEAASLEGAGKLSQFRYITFPLLTPILFFNIVMQIINAFQAFTPAFIISGGTGSPIDSTLLYSLYLFIVGFTQFKMGYASAMAWLLLILITIVTGLLFFSSKYWVFYENE